MTRLIINDCDPDDYIMAVRAAKHLLADYGPEQQDILIAFENGQSFFAKRTLRGISVKKIK